MKRISLITALVFLAFTSNFSIAQEANKTDKFINVAKVKSESIMRNKITFTFIEKDWDLKSIFKNLALDSIKKAVYLTPNNVNKKLVAHFTFYNPTDESIELAFYPGSYFKDIQLYRQINDSIITIESKIPTIKNKKGFRLITNLPNDTMDMWAVITPARSYQSFFSPELIAPHFLTNFELLNKPRRTGQVSSDYFFSGMMLMLVFVTLFRNLHRLRSIAIIYSGYAFAIFLLFMLWVTQQSQSTTFSIYTQEFLSFYTQLASFVLYSIFMLKFLKTKEEHKKLHIIFIGSLMVSIVAILLHLSFILFEYPYPAIYYLEKTTVYTQAVLLILFLVYAITKKEEIIFKYIIWGNLSLLVFGLLSIGISQAGDIFFSNTSFWANSLLYYKVGVILEMFFFQLALFYKNQSLIKAEIKEKQDLQNNLTLQQYEKEIAVYNAAKSERQQIADGLHDKIGKGLSDIRFTSEIGADSNDELKRISKMSDDVLRSMNDLIWTLNTSNDEVRNLVDYFKKYAQNYFGLTHINCIISVPPKIEHQQIDQEKRRVIFTQYKDCLKKILKESKSSEILIDIVCEPRLEIQITTKEDSPIKCKIY